MSDKKHIDRIFQESLKDFEVSPNPKVWKQIQAELNKKEDKKRVIPIWFRYGGVAAILLLLLTVGGIQFNNSKTTTIKVVDTNEDVQPLNSDLNKTNPLVNTKDEININEAITESKPTLSSDEYSNTTNSNINLNQKQVTTPASNNSKVVISKTNKKLNSVKESTLKNNKQNALVSLDNNQKDQRLLNKDKSDNTRIVTTNAVDNTIDTKALSKLNKTDAIVKEDDLSTKISKINTPSTKTTKNGVLLEGTKNNSLTAKTNTKPLDGLDKNKANTIIKDINNATKISSVDTPLNDIVKSETTVDDDLEKKGLTIEEEIEKTKAIIEKEKLANRWQVYTNIAPVYYNTMGKGSHIDEQFIGNSKTGETNTSYGVNLSYVLTDKLSVRSGFNALKLSYDTDNVIIYENVRGLPSANTLKNITLSGNNQSVAALSSENLGVQQVNSIVGKNSNAAISQRLSYYEVPVELEYNLINRKFGVHVIGGFSTFFLNDNQVYSEFDGFKTRIGEANNINDVSFSGNLGLGIGYKFTKKFRFNLEPTFKYQFNAYNNTSGDFRPYIIGVYTGFSYKF